MTPEQKAEEIINKFDRQLGTTKIRQVVAAEICCDEVIAEIEDLQQNCVMEFPMALEYWQKVKAHIQSL